MVPILKNCSWSRLGILCLLLSLYSCGSFEESFYAPPVIIEKQESIDREQDAAEIENLLSPLESRGLGHAPKVSDGKEKGKVANSGGAEDDVIV